MKQLTPLLSTPGDLDLISMTLPEILRPAQSVLHAATLKLESSRKALAAVPPPEPRVFFDIVEEARPMATAVGPQWIGYFWKRSLLGTCAGLAAGMILSRRSGGQQPAIPPLARALEY
jgi:hypothetical protein